MKNIYKIFTVALVALSAIGCSVEEIAPEQGMLQQQEGDYVVVTAGLPGPDTKVSYEMDAANSVVKAAWEKGDVIYRTTGSSSGTAFTQKDSISADGKFANFEGSMSIWANTSYLFTYPVAYRSSSGGNLKIGNNDGTFEQAMTYNYLYGVATADANKKLSNLEFKRLTSFIKISDLEFDSSLSGTVVNISFTGPKVGNKASINMSTGAQFGVDSIYRDLTVNIIPKKDDVYTYTITNGKPDYTEPLYIAFMPLSGTEEGDEYTLNFIMENGDVYQKTWKSSSAYTAGNMYTVSGKVEKPVTFNIPFEQDLIRKKLVYYGYDLNGDEQISNLEASLMTTLGWVFAEDTNITTFKEFVYFTGIATFDANRSGFSGGFYNCTNLKEITLPSSVTVIGSDAFNGCTSLEKFVVPSSVEKINAGAFRNCTNLKEITIPETVTYMGSGLTFANCTSLKTVKWPKGTTNIPSQTFFESGIEEFVINDNVTSIDASAFAKCTSLKSITIPASVKTIAMKVFWGCTGITSFEIPSGVTTIGNEAFYGTGATSFSLPASVTSIGQKAFNNNGNIKTFTIESGSAYSVSEDVSILVKGTEAVCFFGNKSAITFPDGVTTIGAGFAQGSPLLEQVNIPAVTNFGNYAFAECPKLTKAVFDAAATTTGKYTFYNCTALTDVTLPTSVTTLGNSLFSGCSSLKSVTIPAAVNKIESNVFQNCSSLESIELPENLKEIVANLFKGCTALKEISIPNSVTKIGNTAFSGCTSLTKLVLPASLTEIPTGMIQDCIGITSIDIPESVTKIRANAFRGSGLTSFKFPSKVTAIEGSVFMDCKSLKSIEIPETIKTIAYGAFTGAGLESITLPQTITALNGNVFQNCTNLKTVKMPGVTSLNYSNLFKGCTALETIEMPSVKGNIGMWTFQDCKSLKTIVIPEGIAQTGHESFAGCESLKDVTLPTTLTKIGYGSFSGCKALESITIPAAVTSYGYGSWKDCTSLKEVIIQNATPCSIGTGVFPFATNEDLVIYVPDAALEAYKAHASWSADEYKGRIYGVSTRETE